MKQKIVLKVQINCDACRRKAMEVAAKQGVDSVAMQGEDRDLLVATGDGVDPAKLAIELRKKLGHAKIVSVAEVEQAPEAATAKVDGGPKRYDPPAPLRPSPDYWCAYYPPRLLSPPPVIVVHGDYDPPQPCSIM